MSDIRTPKPDETQPLRDTGKGGRSPTYEDGVELGEEVPEDADKAPPRQEDEA